MEGGGSATPCHPFRHSPAAVLIDWLLHESPLDAVIFFIIHTNVLTFTVTLIHYPKRLSS